MEFYEEIAKALDAEGIESRVNDGLLFVPIAPELEVQFQEIDTAGTEVRAANVFLACAEDGVTEGSDAGAGEDLEDFDAALVGVVFSAEAAVQEVLRHIATDEVVSVLRELLEGDDDRIAELEFEQDPEEPLLVQAEIGEYSRIAVQLASADGQPRASVSFRTYGEHFEDMVDDAVAEFLDETGESGVLEREVLLRSAIAEVEEQVVEVLELGTFTDFGELFDVLAVAQHQALEWEELLDPLD